MRQAQRCDSPARGNSNNDNNNKKKDNNCVYKKEREKKKVKKKKGRESQVEQRKWPKFWCLKMTAAAPSLLKSVYFLVC